MSSTADEIARARIDVCRAWWQLVQVTGGRGETAAVAAEHAAIAGEIVAVLRAREGGGRPLLAPSIRPSTDDAAGHYREAATAIRRAEALLDGLARRDRDLLAPARLAGFLAERIEATAPAAPVGGIERLMRRIGGRGPSAQPSSGVASSSAP